MGWTECYSPNCLERSHVGRKCEAETHTMKNGSNKNRQNY